VSVLRSKASSSTSTQTSKETVRVRVRRTFEEISCIMYRVSVMFVLLLVGVGLLGSSSVEAAGGKWYRRCKSRRDECRGRIGDWRRAGSPKNGWMWSVRNYCCGKCWVACTRSKRKSYQKDCDQRGASADPKGRGCAAMGFRA